MKRILLYLTLLFALPHVACSPVDDHASVSHQPMRLASGLKLQSVGSESFEPAPEGATFRAMVYLTGALDFCQTGTYVYDPTADADYLEAASLDDFGVFKHADAMAGANGANVKADVVVVSPGSGVAVGPEGLTGVKVYPNRVNDDGADAGTFYVSQAETFDVSKYASIQFAEPLRERRSKIRFEVRNDESIADGLTVNSIKVVGAGSGIGDDAVVYYPQTRQCEAAPGTSSSIDFEDIATLTDADGKPFCRSASKYVVSAIYASKNVVADILGITQANPNLIDSKYLSMQINFTQGLRTVDADLLLNADIDGKFAELLPRHEYTFKVVISSTYIKVLLSVKNHPGNDWQTPDGSNDVTIDDGDFIDIGTYKINEWGRIDYPEQEIN